MLAAVRRTIKQHALIHPGDRVIAACSGGPDSTALSMALAMLQRDFGFELWLVTIDHQLRTGVDDEIALVRTLASELGVPFVERKVEVAGSVQAGARAARYRALFEVAKELGATRVATGHTRSDQAETVLDRIMRGAGVRGIAGIQVARADGVIRPLIDVSRPDIESFLASRGWRAVFDPSNTDSSFLRVRLRNQIMPLLEAEDSQIESHLSQLAGDAQELRQVVDNLARALLDASASDRASAPPMPRTLAMALKLEPLRAAQAAIVKAALVMWLEPLVGGLKRVQIEALLGLVRRGKGQVALADKHSVQMHDGYLTVIHDPERRTRSENALHAQENPSL